MPTSIALPLLLGLGVDNGIHMVEKLHHSLSEEQNIYQSSTARAMFYGALTTASSFVGLAFRHIRASPAWDW